MRVFVRIPRGKQFPPVATWSLVHGIRSVGDECDAKIASFRTVENLMTYDLVVTWSLRFIQNYKVFRCKGDILTLELGYIGDRHREWVSAGYNGINGMATFVEGDSSRRIELWGENPSILKPWDMTFDRILLVGQVPNDLSLFRAKNIYYWYRKVVNRYRKLGFRKIYWRRHPLDRRTPSSYCPPRAKRDKSETLEQAMRRSLVVTWSSNVGVLSVLAGRPTIAVDPMSMVYGWTSNHYDQWYAFDRLPWLDRMAWTQWRRSELRDGTAWRHLRQRFFNSSVWQTIRNRRSCRRFIPGRPIDKEYLVRILEAGMWAPSGYNSQNQRFVLIDRPDDIRRLAEYKEPRRVVGSSAACIVVLSDNLAHKCKENEHHIWSGLWSQNCAASIENMCLMATDFGIGSCWISFLDSMDGERMLRGKTWRQLLSGWEVPPDHSVHGLLLLGWPAETEDYRWPRGDKYHGGKTVEHRDLNHFVVRRRGE